MKKYLIGKGVTAVLALALTAPVLGGCENVSEQDIQSAAEAVSDAATAISEAAGTSEELEAALNAANAYIRDVDLESLVQLGDYKGVTVEVEKPEISVEDVETYLEYMEQSMPASKEVTGRPVQEGDTVNIAFAGRLKETDEYFDGGTSESYDLVIGSHSFIDGFEEGLIGAEIGETRDLELKFPDSYHAENLAGKEVIFETTVHSIKVQAPMDDAYAAGLGLEGVTDMASLKTYLQKQMQAQDDETYKEKVEEAVIEKVVGNAIVSETPQEMVDRYVAQFNQQATLMAQNYSEMYGYTVTADDFVNMLMTQNNFTGTAEEYIRDRAKQTANRYLVLADVAAQEGITVTDEELEASIKEDLSSATQPYDNLDDYLKALGVSKEGYREELLGHKVAEFLTEQATVKEPAK